MTFVEWWSSVRDDLRSGLRQLRAAPALSVVLITTLGFGIGATIAVFSVVNAVLLRPLPYDAPERLVVVFETLRDNRTGRASVGHFYDWTEQGTVFTATAALQPVVFNLATDDDPERIAGSRVTPTFFDVLHIAPAAGRYFTADDLRRTDRLVVLSHRLWQRRFGGDPAIVGRDVLLNGERYTVTAVASPEYAIAGGPGSTAAGLSPELWTPLSFTPAQRSNYGSHGLLVLGKLKQGIAALAAQRDLERVTADIARRNPREMAARSVNVQSLPSMLVSSAPGQLFFLLGAVASVLLIGCVNVTGVLLARAVARRREMAIRTALGGARSRIVRQLMIESLVMATAAGIVALAVGTAGMRLLVRFGPAGLPRLQQATLSWDVILFAVLLTLTAGTLFGLIPAWKAGAAAMRDHLADGGRHGRFTRSEGIRGTLVVAELALTAILLIVAGLMVRSAYEVEQMPLGFDPDHVLAGRVTLPSAAYREPSAVAAAFDRMVSTLAATPGLDAAGASTTIPLASGNIDAGLTVDGKTFPDTSVPFAQIRLVTAGYIEAVNMPLRAGRSFVAADFAPAAAPVVVINQHLASSLWPGERAIGKRISTWAARANTPEWREVVGVIGDVRTFGLRFPVSSELFLPFTQAPAGAWDSFQRSMTLVLRTGDPTLFADALRRSVRDVDPSVPVYDMSTLAQMLGRSVESQRLRGAIFSTLAVVALGLAAIGIYGVIAFFVSERIPEIGVRLALGATGSRVMTMVIRRGMTLTMAGVAIGLAGAWSISRVLTTLLFGITPTDVPTYVVGTVALLATALVAVALPAYRASRIDPVRSLNA